jgi:hypothetical protein
MLIPDQKIFRGEYPVMPALPEIMPAVRELVYPTPDELLKTEPYNQVIVHFSWFTLSGSQARIWPSTYLISRQGGEKVDLVHAENISFAPQWTFIAQSGIYSFSLIFNGLPSDCVSFDLIEECVHAGRGQGEKNLFVFRDIQRNQTDVYHIYL